MLYVTPDRFRIAGTGLDLDDIEDAEFASIASRATSRVNTHCAVPVQPQQYDFRGGTVTKEQHRWRLGDPWLMAELGSRRVYPNSGPLKSLTSFVVKFTNLYQVTVDPANLYVNALEGWAEVVSIAAVVTGIYPVGVNFGLYTPVAEINYTYGYQFTSTDESLLPTDADTYRAQSQFWFTSPAPSVKVNGTLADPSSYTVDYTEGTITFNTALGASDVVTATYSYPLPDGVRDGTITTMADEVVKRETNSRGMGGLAVVRMAELEMVKEGGGIRGSATAMAQRPTVPPEAAAMLEPFVFTSVR